MRKAPISNPDRSLSVNWLAPALLTTSLFVATLSTAHPVQAGLLATVKPTGEPAPYTKTTSANVNSKSVLARNTTARVEPGTATTASVTPKSNDKKAIGRCWGRLMNMVREVREAHHTRKK